MSDQEIAAANVSTSGAAAPPPAPSGEEPTVARRRRKSADAPAKAPAEAPVIVAPPPAPVITVLPDLGEFEPQEEEFTFRASPAPRANYVAPAPPAPPEEATVVLLPVEILNAERRGELVHLTLGEGVTLCGTPCDPAPASSRPYSVAAGCQRCARMLHRLKARCAACDRPLLHLAGNGACIRCGHVGAVIQLL